MTTTKIDEVSADMGDPVSAKIAVTIFKIGKMPHKKHIQSDVADINNALRDSGATVYIKFRSYCNEKYAWHNEGYTYENRGLSNLNHFLWILLAHFHDRKFQ